MVKLSNNPIAVEASELVEFGCVHCGYSEGQPGIGGSGWTGWTCNECGKFCIALKKGLERTPVGYKDPEDAKKTVYPRLQQHPRKGVPRHGPEPKWMQTGTIHLLIFSDE